MSTSEIPDPLQLAHETLSQLIASGAVPARVTEEIGNIIAGWADEPEINPGIVQYRIAAMWDSVTRDEADLREQASDAEELSDEPMLRRVLAAMETAITTLEKVGGVGDGMRRLLGINDPRGGAVR